MKSNFAPEHPTKTRRWRGRGQLKCDGTRAETRFRLSAKRDESHLNRKGARRFSRLLAAEVCAMSGSNAGYTMLRGSVKSTGYPLHSPVSPSLPPPVRHRVPSYFNWSLLSALDRRVANVARSLYLQEFTPRGLPSGRHWSGRFGDISSLG